MPELSTAGYEHDSVRYETRSGGRVALITLNRPARMNAWTPELLAALYAAYERAGADRNVRAVVLTGAGKGFCAGADMGGLAADSEGREGGFNASAAPRRPPRLPADMILLPTRLPKPVICAINGACAGGGLAFALACDIRLAAAGAKLTAAFPKLGLVAEHGTSWALPHVAGMGNAMHFLLTSRAFSAEECMRMGIVQEVFPKERLLDEALHYAEEMATNVPPASLAVIKQQVWHHPRMPAAEALAESNVMMRPTAGANNPDFKEGIAAFQQRRAPDFAPYDPDREVLRLARRYFGPKGARL